ncbi:glycosyl transferase [Novosphingobium sp. BL-8A]|uniref:glycosyl transferase n=1 Tax=Novosphingobium sp. BL-8A TaxID=3127639 RepID=UPI0037581384
MSAQILDFPTRPSRLALRLEWFATERSVLLAIWALYFALRVAVLFIDVTPGSDAEWYYVRAASIAAGKGYLDGAGAPTALSPPGWPIALGFAFAQFGTSPVTLGIFNLISSLLIGLLTLMLGRRLFGSEGAARLGLLLLAVYPNAIGYVPLALTAVFYTMLLMAGCWAVVARENRWQMVGAGLIFGFASLVKAQTLLVLPLLFAIDWLRMKPMGKRLPRLLVDGLVVVAVAMLVVLPWSVRNRVELGHWIPVSAIGDSSPGVPAADAPMARNDLGTGWIAAHPDKLLTLAPTKLMGLWLPEGEAEQAYQAGAPSYARFEGLYRAVHWGNQIYYGLLMAAFALAFVVMTVRRLHDRIRWAGWWLLPYGLALYATAICLVFSGQSRLHYPFMPFICMAAGWVAVVTLERLAWRRRRVTLH